MHGHNIVLNPVWKRITDPLAAEATCLRLPLFELLVIGGMTGMGSRDIVACELSQRARAQNTRARAHSKVRERERSQAVGGLER